jgi:hypothetical protein
MAEQGWTTQVAAAAGVAAGAGAAQLGIGYGLGVLVWPTAPTTGDAVWLGSLAWAVWIAAGSTVLGAVAAVRLRAATAGRHVGTGALGRSALVVAAAVGAMPTAALIAFPARSAVRADTFAAHWVAGGYAAIGILLGLVIALWAATSRSVAVNVAVTTVWLWTLAVVAVVTGLRAGLLGTGVQLGHWRMTELGDRFYHGTIYWPAAMLAIGAALIIGALAAWPAVRRHDLGLGTAASGAVGPLLVAAAYFTLAPQITGARGMLESAYLIAPYTVLAGLAGSALVVALGNRRAVRRNVTSSTAATPATSATDTEPAPVAGPPDAPVTATSTGRPPVGWLEPNGGAAARAGLDRPATDPAGALPDTAQPARSDGPARPATATGRAKLPSPRTESTPPPAATAPPRSTVKPPPQHPTVATINPPRPAPAESAGPSATPAGSSPTTAAAAPPPATRAASSAARSVNPTPATAAPAKATPAAPRRSTATGASAAPASAAPAAAAPRAEDGAVAAAPGSSAADGAGGKRQAAKGPAAKATPARSATKSSGAAARKSSRPAKAAAVPAFSNADGPADPKPQAAPKGRGATPAASDDPGTGGDAPAPSAVSAALADTAPLWVDDPEASGDDRDGIRNRLRRFGRRNGADNDPGSAN